MKIAKLIAAAALAFAGIAGTATVATAAPVSHAPAYAVAPLAAPVAQDRRYRDGQRYERNDRRVDRRGRGWERNRYSNRRGYRGNRRICRTEYRHHRRVTICRNRR